MPAEISGGSSQKLAGAFPLVAGGSTRGAATPVPPGVQGAAFAGGGPGHHGASPTGKRCSGGCVSFHAACDGGGGSLEPRAP
eukprot:1775308-Heterocapsa_arctica.AAC.1